MPPIIKVTLLISWIHSTITNVILLKFFSWHELFFCSKMNRMTIFELSMISCSDVREETVRMRGITWYDSFCLGKLQLIDDLHYIHGSHGIPLILLLAPLPAMIYR